MADLSELRLYEIEQLAADARRDRDPVDPEVRAFDASLAASARIRGDVLAERNLRYEDERVAGLLDRRGAERRLLYEAFDPRRRQRFTIAHELGHHYLDAPLSVICAPDQVDADNAEDSDVQRDAEREADAFAGAFLMPPPLLRADLSRFGTCVAFLADLYAVTQPAIRRRLRVISRLR